jgi:hypothetical protein
MIATTLSAEKSSEDSNDAVVSLGPSRSFLHVRDARQEKKRGLSGQLASLSLGKKTPSDRLTPSDTMQLFSLISGISFGTSFSYFFRSAARTAGLPIGIAGFYLLMGGKIPTGSLATGMKELYQLTLILEKCPPHTQIAELKTLLKSSPAMKDVHFSSLLGEFLHRAEDLLCNKELSKKEQGEALGELIVHYREKVESLVRGLKVIRLFLITAAGSSLITLAAPQKSTTD